MPDVYVIFRKRLPFRVRLNGQTWEVTSGQMGKSRRNQCVTAECWDYGDQRRKTYTLCSGDAASVHNDLVCGFRVKSGTPERGLVTAMRRAGVALLLSERQPRPPGLL